MNNSGGWADLWLEEASGSCSVLWYRDLVNALSVAWHGFSWSCRCCSQSHTCPCYFLPPSVLHFHLGTSPLSYYTESVQQSIHLYILTYHILYIDYIFSLFGISIQTISGDIWCPWPLTQLPLSVAISISNGITRPCHCALWLGTARTSGKNILKVNYNLILTNI